MGGVGGEPGQDAVWISIREGVDLHRVVGSGRHQLSFLRRTESLAELRHASRDARRREAEPHLQSQGVRLFPNGDELWIIVIQTFPDPDVSIVSTGH